MRFSFDDDYLKKEGVTYEEARFVIETTTFHYPNGYSEGGNPRIMFVGRSGLNQPIIEVAVEFFDEDEELGQEELWHIYHVRKPAKKEARRKAHYEE